MCGTPLKELRARQPLVVNEAEVEEDSIDGTDASEEEGPRTRSKRRHQESFTEVDQQQPRSRRRVD